MKLSAETVSIFKNFATINKGIYVKAGNVIESISEQKNILAKAELKETFSSEFGIHDLDDFLGNFSLQKTEFPELEFEEKDIIISFLSGRSKTKYRKTNKENILVPPDKKINMENAEISLTISQEDLEWVTKVASTNGSPNLAFVSDGSKVSVTTFDAKDDSATVNSTGLDIDPKGQKYRMVFHIDNLKMIPGTYDIVLSSKGIGHFKNKNVSIEYWITTEKGSTYGE